MQADSSGIRWWRKLLLLLGFVHYFVPSPNHSIINDRQADRSNRWTIWEFLHTVLAISTVVKENPARLYAAGKSGRQRLAPEMDALIGRNPHLTVTRKCLKLSDVDQYPPNRIDFEIDFESGRTP
jgi:hypothetical protein